MKKLLTLFTLLFVIVLKSQNIAYDTLVENKIYNSYYSNVNRCPVIVTYKIFKAGGDCSREGDTFKNDIPSLKCASSHDYAASGYDQGHLADSKDFAYDCALQEMTFRYYNCCPQTPLLNRGVWKHYETVVRKMSQTDSLLVICYNHFSDKKLRMSVAIPDVCTKLVYSLTTNKLVLAVSLTNDTEPVESKPSDQLISQILKTIKK